MGNFNNYDKESSVYKNNWDAIYVYYKGKENTPELWQTP
jgi:hypothetical protein